MTNLSHVTDSEDHTQLPVTLADDRLLAEDHSPGSEKERFVKR